MLFIGCKILCKMFTLKNLVKYFTNHTGALPPFGGYAIGSIVEAVNFGNLYLKNFTCYARHAPGNILLKAKQLELHNPISSLYKYIFTQVYIYYKNKIKKGKYTYIHIIFT